MAGFVRKGGSNQRAGGGIRLVPGLDVRAGQTIAGKYRVEELIGSGPSGVVISARNVHLREQVTLKILASYTDGQEELLQRRLKKARLASRLQSAHVARIVDIGVTEEGMPYVATECLDGMTLEAELADRGAMPVEEAARWVLEACEGLAEAHAAGLVHGDLKPQNIFLARPKPSKRARGTNAASTADEEQDASADPRILKLLDFGTTTPLDAIGDQSASPFFGSPAFVAPEQIQTPGAVDARADVWALGVLLYNLVSGGLPFEADTLSGVIVAVVYDAPSLLTDAPYELARLVARCLEKDPANRPQDVRELAAALAPFAGSSGARLSERVRAMLDAGSMSPVALDVNADADEYANEYENGADEPSIEEALPLVTKRAAETGAARPEATRPSARVLARRQARTRTAAFAVLGGAAAIALASWVSTRSPTTASSMTTAATSEVSITSAPLGTSIPSTKTSDLPDAPAAVDTGASATPAASEAVSFAATTAEGITATPLAVTPTPLAESEPFPPRATLSFPSPDALADAPAPARAPAPPPPAVVLPAPRTVTPTSLPNAPNAMASRARSAPAARATTPMRLPPGLPTSREALSVPPPRSDETYLRKLVSDRK